jgi:hypothetical protein
MLREFFQKERTLALIVAIALLVLAIGTQKWAFRYMKIASVEALSPLNSADSIQNLIVNGSLIDTSSKIVTLKRQYLISGKIKSYYQGLGVTYYMNYYAFSICSIVFMTLLSIAVFLIANKGWQNSSILLKSFMLTTIVLSSVYYFLPNVLNNNENLKNNMEKVKVFEKIQFDILSFANKVSQMDNSKIDSSIASNYDRISTNLDFLTTIDNSQLNSELTNLLKSYKPK